MKAPKIDRVLFFSAAIAVSAACITLGIMEDQAAPYVSDLYDWIAFNMGVFYQCFAIGTMIYLAWLVFGRFGNIRLGDDKPDFSTFSWAGMLFCAGTGASLLVWSGVEWAFCPRVVSGARIAARQTIDLFMTSL